MAATFLAEEGVEAAGEGRFEDAASAFERSLDLEDCALTRCNLGVAYERLRRTADAIEAYTAAAALAPEDPVALVNRGDALVRAGRLDDATRASRLEQRRPEASGDGSFSLAFYGGRCGLASSKNFVLESRGRPALQLGKVGRDAFVLDFDLPPVVALGLALAHAFV